jgi:hypothetical protein
VNKKDILQEIKKILKKESNKVDNSRDYDSDGNYIAYEMADFDYLERQIEELFEE